MFRLSPPGQKGGTWTEKVLYSFRGTSGASFTGDGANPNGGLILDGAGNVYGTTYYGGSNFGECNGGVGGTGCGTVFMLSPPAMQGGVWTEEVLHRFGGQDGASPAAGVIFDKRGNLYGTTYFGPQDGFGLVFKLQGAGEGQQSWIETTLSLFNGVSNGSYPDAGLAFDGRGVLYGTTIGSSTRRHGEVYQLASLNSEGGLIPVDVLYQFAGSPDGAHPDGRLVFDTMGNIYSTTQWGGNWAGL